MLFFLRNLFFLHTGDYEIDIYIHYFYVLDIYTLFLCTGYIYIISMYWISGNKI